MVNHMSENINGRLIAKFVSDLNQLQAVRSFVRQVCAKALGNTEKLEFYMQLAINEGFCNIVKHSYHNQAQEEIRIEGQLTTSGLYFTLSDKGNSFNPLNAKPPNLLGERDNGFGIFIIQQIADRISYTPKTVEDQWNHLQIFKNYFFEEDQMELSHYIKDQILVIILLEENLDAKSAPIVKERVLHLIQTTGLLKLVFDLSHLKFIDSSGLGTFLSIQRNLVARKGTLKLAHLNTPVRTMFEIVSMHRIFDIFPNVEEAVQSF